MPKEPRNFDAEQRQKSRKQLKEKLRRLVDEDRLEEVPQVVEEHTCKLNDIGAVEPDKQARDDVIDALSDLLRPKG